MTVLPGAVDSGIVFRRTDLPGKPEIPAVAEHVSNTALSTTISNNGADVVTIEHIMSALAGIGVDNAVVEIDNREVPILDGSARLFVEALVKNGLKDQGVPRRMIEIPVSMEVTDPKTGSRIRIEPADSPSADITVDFGSDVLGVQYVHWDLSTDYAKEIAPCRTFCFYRDIEAMLRNNLIKGGDLENALVITDDGYMGNPTLHFPNECGRHKLLDLIGDFRLAGGFIKAHITAYKPGHSINTKAVKALRALQ